MEHFCSQWNCCAKSASHCKSGKPKKLSKRDKSFLQRKVHKDTFLRIQKLLTEFDSLSPEKTVWHCTIQRLLVRHNLIGRAAAR